MGIKNAIGVNTWGDVTTYLRREYYESPAERARRAEIALRRRLFRGSGLDDMFTLIEKLFRDKEVQSQRKNSAEIANFDNVLSNVVGLVSHVYQRGATRTVGAEGDGGEGDKRYQELQRVTKMDAMMARLNALVNLTNDVWLGFRVMPSDRPMIEDGAIVVRDDGSIADDPDGRVPRVDIITQDRFWAVSHPDDDQLLVGMIFELGGRPFSDRPARYVMWTADERVELTREWNVLESSVRPNDWGTLPGLLVHREPPDERLLDWESGRDLVNAHLATWLQHAMMIRESRAISKQIAFAGDLAGTPTGQPQDSTVDMQLPEGMVAQTIDRGTDLGPFMTASNYVTERSAANRGIPPTVLRHSGATSGHEIELRRLPLMEKRAQQIKNYRDVERAFAEIQASIVATDIPRYLFSTDGWRIDYPEIEIPLGAMDALAQFEKKRQLNLTSTIEYIRRENPDLDDDDAAGRVLAKYIQDELTRNEVMRSLTDVSGGASQTVEEAAAVDEAVATGEPMDEPVEEVA